MKGWSTMEVHVFRMSAAVSLAPYSCAWDGRQTLVLAFFAPDFALVPTPLDRLRAAFPQSFLLGCSTGGEVHGPGVEDHSIAVAVLRFASTGLYMARAHVSPGPAASREAGEKLGRALAAPDLKGVFVLSDGLHVNGSELASGFNAVLPVHVKVSGAMAADGERFKNTYILAAGPGEPIRLLRHQVGAIGFCGNSIHLAHGSSGGWSPFGLERCVTRSEGNVLFELDGKPALQLYKNYLGERAQDLPATAFLFPLAILDKTANSSEVLVRTVLGVNEEAQSLTFAGDIPEGATVQLMHSHIDRLIEGAAGAAERLGKVAQGPALAIAVTCVGRRMVMRERSEEGLEAVLDALPEGIPLVGFFSYGALSPLSSGLCQLQNQTMTLTLVQED
jgi:hypothetical protein